MTPVVVRSPGGECFGMYQSAPGSAVLIIPPFGEEALKTARIWRSLALELAEEGLATLRFDLPGTGNSAGRSTDQDRVAAWRVAISACAGWLADRHGGRVTLFGHRFGALLALDAVATVSSIERLVLLDPPASGPSLVRYLKASARMKAFGPPPEGPDYIQTGGVALSRATLNDLSELPVSLPKCLLPPALLILNEVSGMPSPWPDRLRKGGSVVETMPFHGFDALVRRDAFHSETPTLVLQRVVSYLKSSSVASSLSNRSAPLIPATLTLDGATEAPIKFGPDMGMFGILCRPNAPSFTKSALLLPTTGIDPCSGMSRMWTDLARQLADLGISSLRFDMTGVGESQGNLTSSPLTAAYHPDRIADLGHAVDALTGQGFSHVTVVGYCAGAYAAWHAAITDTRIAGVLAGNLAYFNLQTVLKEDVLYLQPGKSRLGIDPGLITGWLPTTGKVFLRRLDDNLRTFAPRFLRHFFRHWEADQQRTRRGVKALTTRGCAVRMVMSEGDLGHNRLRRAYGERLRLPSGVELTVIPEADHQFSDRRHRARFLKVAEEFALGI